MSGRLAKGLRMMPERATWHDASRCHIRRASTTTSGTSGYRTLISREGRTFRTNVCALLGGGGPASRRPAGGSPCAWTPSRRTGAAATWTTSQSHVLDALQHAGVYEDDSQIDLLLTRRREVVPGGRLNVTLIGHAAAAVPAVRVPRAKG